MKRALQGSGPVFSSCPFLSPSCPPTAPGPVSPIQRGLARVRLLPASEPGSSALRSALGIPGLQHLEGGRAPRGGEAVVKLDRPQDVRGCGPEEVGSLERRGLGSGNGRWPFPKPHPIVLSASY